MELFYRKTGTGKPLIILHGLYGSGDNWYSVAKELSVFFTVYLIDQRNHGNSPHDPLHDYRNLAQDLNEFVQQRHIDRAFFIGHSMGGKTSLAFGLKHPEMVEKMIVVDISPFAYTENGDSEESRMHRQIIRSLLNLDINHIKSREEASRELSDSIPSAMVRQFLLKSLKRRHDKKFEWAINLEALADNMPAIFDSIIEENTDPRSIPVFPLLFIKGEKSGYMRQRDLEAMHHYFPHASVTSIPDAGHWVHAEQQEAFVEAVKKFMVGQETS